MPTVLNSTQTAYEMAVNFLLHLTSQLNDYFIKNKAKCTECKCHLSPHDYTGQSNCGAKCLKKTHQSLHLKKNLEGRKNNQEPYKIAFSPNKKKY